MRQRLSILWERTDIARTEYGKKEFFYDADAYSIEGIGKRLKEVSR